MATTGFRARTSTRQRNPLAGKLLRICPFSCLLLLVYTVLLDYESPPDGFLLRDPSLSRRRRLKLLSLDELTISSYHQCPNAKHIYMRNENNSGNVAPKRSIPRIIHQTSRTRCVTERVAENTAKWLGYPGYRYFFHDDEAVLRLVEQTEFPEFPQLSSVARKCLVHGTIRADLWRYLVLWVYGGIYVDIDAVPNKFHPEHSIDLLTDGYFVVEQYHLLSQWFMAVSPKHPIMFYAIQHSLANLIQVGDTGVVAGRLLGNLVVCGSSHPTSGFFSCNCSPRDNWSSCPPCCIPRFHERRRNSN